MFPRTTTMCTANLTMRTVKLAIRPITPTMWAIRTPPSGSKAQQLEYKEDLIISCIFHCRFPVNQKPPVLTGPNPEWRNRVTPVIGNRDGFTPDFDSLIHNTNQEDADFDVFNQPRPSSQPAAQDRKSDQENPPKNASNSYLSFAFTADRRPSWGASQPRPTPQTTRAPGRFPSPSS